MRFVLISTAQIAGMSLNHRAARKHRCWERDSTRDDSWWQSSAWRSCWKRRGQPSPSREQPPGRRAPNGRPRRSPSSDRHGDPREGPRRSPPPTGSCFAAARNCSARSMSHLPTRARRSWPGGNWSGLLFPTGLRGGRTPKGRPSSEPFVSIENGWPTGVATARRGRRRQIGSPPGSIASCPSPRGRLPPRPSSRFDPAGATSRPWNDEASRPPGS